MALSETASSEVLLSGKGRSALAVMMAGVLLAAGLLMVGLLAGCSAGSSGSDGAGSGSGDAAVSTRTVTDMRGRTVEIPDDAQSIVAIACALRPVCYLGAEDLVVGVEASEQTDTVTCAYRHVNHDLFASLPVVGDGGSNGVTVNEEAVLSLAPDLIVSASIEADEADALQQRTGIPVVCLTQPETIFEQEYYDNLTFLGEVLNKQDRAAEVVGYLQGAEADLMARAEASASYGQVSAYAAGISYRGGHGFDGTEANFSPFNACGIANIADGQGSSGPYTIDLEAVSTAQPDYVFVESSNLSLVGEDYQNRPDYFNALQAVQEGNVYSLISYRFYSTNVELALANCYQIGAMVYPDTFGDVNPIEKLDEISEFFLGVPLSEDLAAEGYEFMQVDLASL